MTNTESAEKAAECTSNNHGNRSVVGSDSFHQIIKIEKEVTYFLIQSESKNLPNLYRTNDIQTVTTWSVQTLEPHSLFALTKHCIFFVLLQTYNA